MHSHVSRFLLTSSDAPQKSYAGHYIPAIAHRIRKGNNNHAESHLLQLHLSGLAIGNGFYDMEEQMKSFPEMAYNNPHGIKIVDEAGYHAMKAAAASCSKDAHTCKGGRGSDVDRKFTCQKASNCEEHFFDPLHEKNISIYDISKPCIGPDCTDETAITKFLNNNRTKATLGVPSKVSWHECNDHVSIVWSDVDRVESFAPYVSEMLNDGLPVLIYSGDLDYICNYKGNKAVALKLEWKHGDAFRKASDHDWNGGGGLARSANGFSFLQVSVNGRAYFASPCVQMHLTTSWYHRRSTTLVTCCPEINPSRPWP